MLKLLRKITSRMFNKNNKNLAINVNKTAYRKNCLILYVLAPFVGKRISSSHQNQWQAKELARIIGGFGYNVDVINFDNRNARLNKMYDLVVDIHPGMNEVYKPFTAPDCVKIAYITGSNPDFSNHAEAGRLADLESRRGVMLKQRRFVQPFAKADIESFDALLFICNYYNYTTYKDFNIKRYFLIRNNGIPLLPIQTANKRSPSNFLFLASSGQVHKGLDLLLEIFARNKSITLYICSSFRSEEDFCCLYDRELFHSDNIKPIGFVDVTGAVFQEIASVCSYSLFPSCSEGIASSVLTAMSAGLIPIMSRECGFEDDEGLFFQDCSLATITDTINEFAGKSPEWIQHESEKAMSIARTRYSSDEYTESVRLAFMKLFSELSVAEIYGAE